MDERTSATSSGGNPQKPLPNSVSTLTMVPMTKEQGAKLIGRMLGAYPSLSLHDPKTYIANMVTLLCGYPLWAGEEAISAVKKKTRFIPTEAELYEELHERTTAARYAAEWERDAARMLEQRALPAPPSAPKLSYDELRAKYDGPNGEKWGITNPDATKTHKTPGQSQAELIAQIGQEAFDAIPNAKPTAGTIGDAAASVARKV